MPEHTPDAGVATAARHPDHDDVAREVRRWYTTTIPELDIHVEDHRFGSLARRGSSWARLVLTVDDPGEVAPSLAAARAACPDAELTVLVDDRTRARRIDTAIQQAGYARRNTITYLALVGPPATLTEAPSTLRVEPVPEERLESWARVKLQAFADTEAEPAPAELDAEVAARRAELALARYQLGTVDDEPAAALAYYPGRDQLVFLLGTKVPFRHRGIAQGMLHRWAEAGLAGGCRSLMINAHQGSQAETLYRRLGFRDEVYWYRSYSPRKPATAG